MSDQSISSHNSPERHLPDVLGVPLQAQDVHVDMPSTREVLVADEGQLLDWVAAHHPDSEPAIATYQLRHTAQPDDIFHFADRTDPSEKYVARVSTRMDRDETRDFGYHIEHPVDPKHNRTAGLRNVFVAESDEELEAKFEATREFEAHKSRLIESHPLGVGILTLTNEFGGFTVGSNEAIAKTAVDVVARALVAHRLGHGTLRDVVQAGLIEPLTAHVIAKPLAPIFAEVHKTAAILDQLPVEARAAAGAPLMDVLLEKMRTMLHQVQPDLFVLAAIRNSRENAVHIATIVRHEEDVMKSLVNGRGLGNIDDFGFRVR